MNVLIGISGGIACYKTAELIRLFKKANHQVKVVMTKDAKAFVQPLTFSALCQHAVYDDMFSSTDGSMPHINLAKWADQIIIAPATANTISKLAVGSAHDLLSCICLATTAPCYIAPAMNQAMWQHPATQRNLKTLQQDGYHILPTENGEQACGDVGLGRMLEPSAIFEHLSQASQTLSNVNVVITAGSTQERIDPIRYISNFSSGKMGYAMASACQRLGANVCLITGPTQLTPPIGCKVTNILSVDELRNAVLAHIETTDIYISTAAIADYKPCFSSQKIKKSQDRLTLELTKTPDVLTEVSTKYPAVFTVGFCAETNDLLTHAQQKLEQKQLNAIVANQISDKGYPFNADTNALTYINHKAVTPLPTDSKLKLAEKIMGMVIQDFNDTSQQ